MGKFFFRVATENDLVFILRLSARVFSVYGDYQDIIADWFSRPGVTSVIITDKAEPLGFAMIEFGAQSGLIPTMGDLLAIAVFSFLTIDPIHHRYQ